MKALTRRIRSALAAALSLAALPALAAKPEDAWITTKVKVALLTDDRIDGLGIDVDTMDGRVTLHGQVASPADKGEAEALAQAVDGVVGVRNLIVVVPAAAQPSLRVSDDALARVVRTVLERDRALAGSRIEVKSVHGGVVVLAGRAQTLSAHQRALEDARAVPGVRQVASEIRSPDERADARIWEQSGEAGTGAELASSAADAWITTKVKLRLIADPGVSPTSVSVDTRRGIVTLFGTVESEEAKLRAESQVHEVSGVRGVANDLQVVPAAAARRVAAADEAVRRAIRERLGARDELDDARIDVEVKNGVARLTGTVASQRDRLTVLTLARRTEGVGAVIDALDLQPPKG